MNPIAVQKLITELAKKGLKVEHFSDSDHPIFELIGRRRREGDGACGVFDTRKFSQGFSRSGGRECKSSASKAWVK